MKTMKVKDLKKILIEAHRLIGNSPIIPITGFFLVNEGFLTVFAWNIIMQYKVPFDGLFLCHIKELKDILSSLSPSDNIDLISIQSNDNHPDKDKEKDGKEKVKPLDKIHVQVNGKDSFTLTGERTEDFPYSPETSTKIVGKLTQEDCLNILKLKNIASKDDLRPAMSGACLNENEIAATNGHLLVWNELNGKYKGDPIILPSGIFKLNLSADEYKITEPKETTMKRDGEECTSGWVKLISEYSTISLQLINEKYPDYPNVIPRENPLSVVLNRKEFIAELKKGVASANKTTHQVRLTFKEHNMKLHTEDIDMGNEYNGEMSVRTMVAKIEGQPINLEDKFEIGMNGKFLLEILKHRDTNLVTIAMSAPTRGAIFDSSILVMPVMLSNY